MRKITIAHLKTLRESEDKVEFKRAAQGNFAYDGGSKPNPKDRRKCILGYVTALCNEGGGYLVLRTDPSGILQRPRDTGPQGPYRCAHLEHVTHPAPSPSEPRAVTHAPGP